MCAHQDHTSGTAPQPEAPVYTEGTVYPSSSEPALPIDKQDGQAKFMDVVEKVQNNPELDKYARTV